MEKKGRVSYFYFRKDPLAKGNGNRLRVVHTLEGPGCGRLGNDLHFRRRQTRPPFGGHSHIGLFLSVHRPYLIAERGLSSCPSIDLTARGNQLYVPFHDVLGELVGLGGSEFALQDLVE